MKLSLRVRAKSPNGKAKRTTGRKPTAGRLHNRYLCRRTALPPAVITGVYMQAIEFAAAPVSRGNVSIVVVRTFRLGVP
jgi:hypothetical protein